MTSTAQLGTTKSASLISHGQLAKYMYTLLYAAMAMAISSHEQPGPAMGTRPSQVQPDPTMSSQACRGQVQPWPVSNGQATKSFNIQPSPTMASQLCPDSQVQ